MKTKFITFALLLVVTLFLTLIGCSDDLYHQGSAPVTKNKIVSIDEFKRKTGLQNFNKTFKIPKNNNLAYRKADGSYELSDFEINFDYIKQVVVENKVSYTFNIEPKIVTSKSIFNLVVYNYEGNWETSILELIPTEENFDKLLSGLDNKFTGNVKQVYSARIPGNCYAIAYYIENCTYKDTDACRITCDRCNLCLTLVRYNVCQDTQIMQPLYPLSGSGGGAGSGLIDPSGYIFDPNLYELGSPKYLQSKNASLFWNDLSHSQQLWATKNPEEYNHIIQYQIANYWSFASKQFAKEMINYSVLNNNSPESTQEIINILNIIDDGIVNGQSVVVGPDTPITNMAEYLRCFNTAQSATITIYADQPVTGSHSIISPTESVGHAFISIKQGVKVKTLGFYPISSIRSVIPNPLTLQPNDFFSTPGVFGNDQGHSYDVSLSLPLTPTGLANVINSIVAVAENNPQYNIGSMNCTDLAILIFNSETIMNVPYSESPSPWSGQTPGTLGETIRDLEVASGTGGVKNTSGGNAPNNNCN
jgi:hypothetical protein